MARTATCVSTPRPGSSPDFVTLRTPAPAAEALFRRERTSRQARGRESAVPDRTAPAPRATPRHGNGSMTRRDATRRNGIKGEPNRTAGGRRPEPRQAATAKPAHRNRDRAGEAAGETEEGTRARGSCNGSMKLAQHGAAGSARTVRAYYQCHRLLSESWLTPSLARSGPAVASSITGSRSVAVAREPAFAALHRCCLLLRPYGLVYMSRLHFFPAAMQVSLAWTLTLGVRVYQSRGGSQESQLQGSVHSDPGPGYEWLRAFYICTYIYYSS